ncbi:MAG: hypothetical protein E7428_02970 [Ruminococcaceae bacterium]|nr:hypothetical protein [Oscillospiraceae bacterium]
MQRDSKILLVCFVAVMMLSCIFTSCGKVEANEQTEEEKNEIPMQEENVTEATENIEAEDESVVIDLTVEGRSEGLSGEELEKEMVALMHDRSEAVKAAELAGWYNPLTDRITVTYSDGSFDITDETTLEKIASLLAVENLRACVSSPEYEKPFGEEEYGEILFDALTAYSNFLGGKTMLLDFHNGTYAFVFETTPDLETNPDQVEGKEQIYTEVRIGKQVRYEDGDAIIENILEEPPFHFLYSYGNYNTSVEIKTLMNSLIS